MKKILSILMATVISLGALSGCSGASSDAEKVENSNSVSSAVEKTESSIAVSAQAASIKTVTDELGREVTIPENPQKVIGLTSAVMEALYNVGISPIAKVEEYKIREEGMALPSIGQTTKLNVEAICELSPDFIIASSRYHASFKAELESVGCPVYFFDPDAVGDISIVDLTPFIGELLGKTEVGDNYKNAILTTAEELKTAISQKSDIRTGLIIRTGETVTCAQRASGYGALLILLGIENIVPDDLPNASKSPYVAYDIEQIVLDNPDVIFIIAPSKDTESNKKVLQDFKADEKWSKLSAVQNNNIFMLPFSVNPNRMNVENMLKTTAGLITKEK